MNTDKILNHSKEITDHVERLRNQHDRVGIQVGAGLAIIDSGGEIEKVESRLEDALDKHGKASRQIDEIAANAVALATLVDEGDEVPTPDDGGTGGDTGGGGDETPDPPAPEPDPDEEVPDVDPVPADALLDPVEIIIDGEEVQFNTPTPDFDIGSHPRFATPEFIERGRANWDDPLFVKERKRSEGRPLGDALKYLLFKDETAGQRAKAWLLSQPTDVTYKYVSDRAFEAVLLYDWTWDLYTPEERTLAMEVCLLMCGLYLPGPGTAQFNFLPDFAEHRKMLDWSYGFTTTNDPNEPKSHGKGFVCRTAVALAFWGDGVRNVWCDASMKAATSDDPLPIYKIYEPTWGGLFDGFNICSGQEGGFQAGNNQNGIMTGYNGMFFVAPLNLLILWGLATGDWRPIIRNSWYRHLGKAFASGFMPDRHNEGILGGGASYKVGGLCSILLGLLPKHEADTQLLHWCIEQTPKNTYGTRYDELNILLSDRTVPTLDPASALAKYGRCSDDYYSRSSWTMYDDTVLYMSDRENDGLRHENDIGVVGLYRGAAALLPRAQHKKGHVNTIYGCGIWTWKHGNPEWGGQDDGTYWGNDSNKNPYPQPNNYDYVGRTKRPLKLATHAGCRGPKTAYVQMVSSNGLPYTGAFVDSAPNRVYYDVDSKTYYDAKIEKTERQVYHVPSVGGREFVIIRDVLKVHPDTDYCWGTRAMNYPTFNDDGTVDLTDGDWYLHITPIIRNGHEVERVLRGGEPKVTEGPYGRSFDKHGYYFRDSPDSLPDNEAGHSEMFGQYGVFFLPKARTTEFQYEFVMEVLPLDEQPADIQLAADGMVDVGDLFTYEGTSGDHLRIL